MLPHDGHPVVPRAAEVLWRCKALVTSLAQLSSSVPPSSQDLNEPEVMTTCGEKPPEATAELIANLWPLHKWRTFVINNEDPKLWGELSPQPDSDAEAVTPSLSSHLCLQSRL